MLGSFLKRFFGGIGRLFMETLTRSGVTPNQVTCAGFALVLLNCGLYLVVQDTYVFGLGLALSFSFDALDGAIARRQKMSTKFGGYLDAIVDRYQEIASFLVLALVNGWWLVTFVLTVGCLMISYNKAAAAIEIAIDDKGWPDLMERARRSWIFCAALIFDNTIPVPATWGGHFIYLILWYLAVLSNFTALQRFVRAKRLLVAEDERRASRRVAIS